MRARVCAGLLQIGVPEAFIIKAEIIAVTTGFTTNHGVDNHTKRQIPVGLQCLHSSDSTQFTAF